MSKDKVREYYITRDMLAYTRDEWAQQSQLSGIMKTMQDPIRVIEKSDYDKALSALREAVEALSLFGSQCRYTGHGIDFNSCDCAVHNKNRLLTKIKASFPDLTVPKSRTYVPEKETGGE